MIGYCFAIYHYTGINPKLIKVCFFITSHVGYNVKLFVVCEALLMLCGPFVDEFFEVFHLLFLDLPAFCRAIATASFCGRPDFLSSLILELIVFLLLPFFSGMIPYFGAR